MDLQSSPIAIPAQQSKINSWLLRFSSPTQTIEIYVISDYEPDYESM